MLMSCDFVLFFFFFNDTATTEIYTLSLHDALPISILLHPEHDRRRPSEHALGGARQDGGVLRLVPFDGELIGSSDDQAPIVQRDRHRGLQPRPHRSVGKFAPRFVEESLPSFFS